MAVPTDDDLARLAARVVEVIAMDTSHHWAAIVQANGDLPREVAEAFCAIALADGATSEDIVVEMAAAYTKVWWILDYRGRE